MSQRYIGGLIYNPPGGFSGLFDGSGDYLQLADSTAWDLTGDYTIEMWLFKNASASQTFFQLGTSSNILLYQNASNQIIFYSGAAIITASVTASLNTWNHVALVRSGSGSNNTVLYLNGVNVGQATNTTSFTGDASNGVRIGAEYPTGFEFNGYISNVRVVKGTALYTAAFTPPNGPPQAVTNTQLLTCAYSTFRDGSTNNFTITVNGNTAVSTQNPFPLTTLPNPALGNQGNGVYSMSQYQSLLSQNLWPAVDPYWRYVTLMLHGNGTNGAQNNTFLDSSTNNFTITRNGNTTQGTFAPYGSNWSNYFDGSGDYLSCGAANQASSTFTGDFTIEAWFNFSSIAADCAIVFCLEAGPPELGWNFRWRQASSGFRFFSTSVGTFDFSYTPTVGVWTHVALSRSGTNLRCFVNGAQIGTTQTASGTVSRSTANPLQVGGGVYNATSTNGYLSNVRIVNGTAVYTANFTPPTSPLTAITNTSLLTCQSNRFIDNSTNAFTITVNGNTSVQRFSPFNPTAPYAAGTDGGSGYFDGTGDYLTTGTSSEFTLGTGDFTIELWYNPAVSYASGNGYLFDMGSNGTRIQLYLNTVYFLPASGNSIQSSAGVGMTVNAWTHVAAVRSGSTMTLYVNGVSAGTTTNSNNLTDNKITIGSAGYVGDYFNGYISNLRVVKGTAVYTSAFTPPTAPLTAITNTSFLTNFTNAGIIDNAEMNNLETVGNAQISTAQSKFGGASMSFDGSGDWLIGPNSKGLYIGSGNFTIEGWVYLNAIGTQYAVVSQFNANGTGPGWTLYIKSNNVLEFYGGSGTVTVTGTTALTATTWTHFAVVRNGSTITIYVNGTAGGTATNSSFSDDTSALMYVGGRADSSAIALNGYIDDLRITKGYARYTTSFTPQRSQWQDQ